MGARKFPAAPGRQWSLEGRGQIRSVLGAITVDDKVNPTIPLDDLLNSGLNLSRIPDVRLDGQAGISGGCGKFLGCLF
jgi:hypothetical protein